MGNKQVFLTRQSSALWRVTFNNPPLNIFGPKMIPQLNEIITAIETDDQLKVVVFDSAIDGFFMTHYDFLAKPEETTSLPPGPNRTGASERYAGPLEPGPGRVNRVDPGACHRCRK